ATASLLKGVRLRAEQQDTRKHSELADGLVRALGSLQVFTGPGDDFERVARELAAITPEQCHAAFKKSWDTADVQVFIGGNLKLEQAPSTILAAYRESAQQPVAAAKQHEGAAFAYTQFGAQGTVIKRSEVKDLGITQVVFSNNVRANIKQTDFEKNSVRLMATFGGGKLEAVAAKPGIIPFAQSVFPLAGLEKHSVDDLRRIFASQTVSMEFAVGDDSFVLAGKTTPQDFEAQCQRLCANLVAPGWRVEAERQFQKNLDSIYTELEHTAEGVMQNTVVGFIHSGDQRFAFPKREVMAGRNLADLKEWLAPALSESYMEVAVVGDSEIEKTIEVLARTFGAIPKRAEKQKDYTEARKVPFPTEPQDHDIGFATEIPRAYALAYWPTADMLDIKRTRRLILLGDVLDDRLRLKIREELGETYSPASYHVASDTFTGYGYMTAMATLKPEQVAKVKPMFLDIAKNIGRGITADEFQRAREPQLQQLVQMRRDNRYWITRVLVNCQSQPYRLDWSRSLVDDFSGIKKEDLEILATQFLGSERALTIGLMPHEGAAPENASKGAFNK
ncbi:MAG: M16 family metallopeptidase, partial [Roseimicrobium sp.]